MKPARILVVSPNWIGDAVMAQPLLAVLRERHPDAPIDVMAPPTVAPVWRAVAQADTVLEAEFRRGALQLRARWAYARMLRARGYTHCYVLPNTLKSALIPWLAGIAHRIGYLGEMRRGLLNVIHRDDPRSPRAMVPFYAALALPPADTPPVPPRPRLEVSAQADTQAVQAAGLPPGLPYLIFAPGAEFGPAKRWPAAHFAALADAVAEARPDLRIALLGSPKDKEVCDAIMALARHPAALHNLAGATGLGQAIALIAGSAAMVANDSGLLHVASALNRPVVALYGPTDPGHAPPFSDLARSLSLQLDCAPCRQRVCPLGHHRCLNDLLPAEVYAAVRAVCAL